MVATTRFSESTSWSVAEYHRMGEKGHFARDARVELINGEIINMTPIGCNHAGTVKRLSSLFNEALGKRFIVSVQDPIILGEHSEPEPDLALLLPRSDFYSTSHPIASDVQLLVEVADTSLRYDRDVKLPLYASHGIAEVWLVDLEGSQLTMCHSPSEGRYEVQQSARALDDVVPRMAADVTLNLSGLFT